MNVWRVEETLESESVKSQFATGWHPPQIVEVVSRKITWFNETSERTYRVTKWPLNDSPNRIDFSGRTTA